MMVSGGWAARRGRSALVALLLGALALLGAVEGYTEEMLVQGVDGAALVHFEAVATVSLHSQHTGSFPASLLALARQQGVQQLELSLTRGRWAWSQQQHDAAIGGSKPPGLELKVAFSSAVSDTQAAYGVVTQSLGGLLCAGVATVPQLAVMAAPAVGWLTHQSPAVAAPSGHGRQQQQQHNSAQRQLYAWLPQEGVCSENLAAWRRLLPCCHQAGLAALLQPVQLAAASYVSLGLQMQPVPPSGAASSGSDSSSSSTTDGQQPQVQLRLVLTAVLPLPAASEQQQQQGLVEALFGCSLPAACPAAASSRLYVAPSAAAVLDNTSSACSRHATPAGPLLVCDALQHQREELHVPSSLLNGGSGAAGSSGSSSAPPALQVVQHAVQRSSRAGTLVVGVRVPAAALRLGDNDQASDSSSGLLHVMQLVPWQLPVDAASLRLELNGQALQGPGGQLLWQSLDARPDRTARIELLLRLPATTAAGAGGGGGAANCGGRQWHEVKLSVDYSVAFVGVFDLPPDASRGIDIPPAVATLLPPACANASTLLPGQQQLGSSSSAGSAADVASSQPPLLRRLSAASGCMPVQQYSGSAGGWGGAAGASGATGGGAVVPLPIPDLSMPFNVICFTSTLLAVVFGGVANVVLRSPEDLAGGGEAGGKGGTPRWKRKARRLVALLLLMAALAVYLDRDLQRQLDATLHHWVLGRTRSPEQHGEL